MKNLIKTFAFLLLTIFATQSIAQNFGVRAGINLANQNIEGESADSKLGLVIGALAEIGINDLLSVQPEINFLQKGTKEEFDFLGTTSESKITMNYLDIPINLKAGFDAGSAKVYVLAGPSIGLGLGGEAEFCAGGDCDSEDIDFSEDGANRVEIGASLGAGVQFGQIFVDLRYVLGLTDIAEDGEYKNRGFQITGGYMFGGE